VDNRLPGHRSDADVLFEHTFQGRYFWSQNSRYIAFLDKRTSGDPSVLPPASGGNVDSRSRDLPETSAFALIVADVRIQPPLLLSFAMLDCDNPANNRCATGELRGAEFKTQGITLTLNRRETPLTIPWTEFHAVKTPRRGTMD